MTPEAEDFEKNIAKIVSAIGKPEITVSLPLRVPFYKRREFGGFILITSPILVVGMFYAMFLGDCAPEWGALLLGASPILWVLLLIEFRNPLLLRSTWKITAAMGSHTPYVTYTAEVGTHKESRHSITNLMGAKGGISPELVAAAFLKVLEEGNPKAVLFEKANSQIQAGLAKHKILEDLQGM